MSVLAESRALRATVWVLATYACFLVGSSQPWNRPADGEPAGADGRDRQAPDERALAMTAHVPHGQAAVADVPAQADGTRTRSPVRCADESHRPTREPGPSQPDTLVATAVPEESGGVALGVGGLAVELHGWGTGRSRSGRPGLLYLPLTIRIQP